MGQLIGGRLSLLSLIATLSVAFLSWNLRVSLNIPPPSSWSSSSSLSIGATQQKPSSPSIDSKRFLVVYLSQGPAASYERLKRRFDSLPNAVFFYHSYDVECPGCIFQSNTTLPEGRNLVLKTSLAVGNRRQATPLEPWTNDQVKYYVMMDDDVEVQCLSRRDCWQEYHTMLLDDRTTWPFLAPKYYVDWDDEPTAYHTCRDDSLWVMRWDHVDFLYPYPTKHQAKTWNIYVQSTWERMKRCFPNGFLSHKGYRNVNSRHGGYPKGLRKALVADLLNSEYPTLGPWVVNKTETTTPFRCTPARNDPPIQEWVDPICKNLTEWRFRRWLDGTYNP